jgi:aminoglycoside phosphotransferase (APT) family kinase protein
MDESVATWDWTPETRQRLSVSLEGKGLTDGPLSTRPIGDGHSNLTYLVSDGTREVIVRRPPPPPLPAGANDMLREARFMSGLAGTGVPVPQVLAIAQADEVLDVPFYVMSVADGPVVTTLTPSPLDSATTRREIGESLIDSLADLHAVDWMQQGMGDLGRPAGFNRRHLRRMGSLVSGEDGRLSPGFAPVAEWLESNAPDESGATIVHNDFRIGNVVLAPEGPGRVSAILDWELATLGDPLFDLGYFLASVPVAGSPQTPTESLGTAMLEDGYPSREELAARYADRTGHNLDGLAWYSTLALWKLAALYDYGRRRAESGAGDQYYDASQVDSFLDAAHRTAGISRKAAHA